MFGFANKKIVMRQDFKDPHFQDQDNQVPIITLIKLNIPAPAEWPQRSFNFCIFEPLSDKISVLSSIRCRFGFGFGIGHLSGIPTKITPLFFFVPIFVTFNQPSQQPPPLPILFLLNFQNVGIPTDIGL